MKKLYLIHILSILAAFQGFCQNNISLSNPEAQQILSGNYDPAGYAPSTIINHPDSILHGIINQVSKDTLISYLMKIDSYYNRNTGSDTVSEIRGIGAVRRWIYRKFGEYSQLNENRLITSYLDFDISVCGQTHHRNVLAILPGLDTTNKEIMVLEGHFDTRCQGACDTACYTPGMEDNGSGTVLVMELARIMSRYAFDHTILFACVTGEDQDLYGSKALSTYLKNHDIPIRAVFNNDVIGGIICGQTSSPPGCPGLNSIDSTHVRIFSYSPYNDSSQMSPHKQLARYIRLHQEERINPLLETPMMIDIIISEDRIGRSGDHFPFRQKSYTAIRFTSRNEHGNGSGTPPDRQHTSDDILGLDLTVPPDGIIDTFFVDPGYLRRNIIMNGVNLGLMAIAPPIPAPEFAMSGDTVIINLKEADTMYRHYRVGIRSKYSGTLYFDSVLTFTNTTTIRIPGVVSGVRRLISVANVENNVESLFSQEYAILPVGVEESSLNKLAVRILKNYPNPFSDCTEIMVEASENLNFREATLFVTDITGRILKRIPVHIMGGTNRFSVSGEGLEEGIYLVSLNVSGRVVATGKISLQE